MMREIWGWSFEVEMSNIESIMHLYPYVSIDTEFPGFLRSSPRNASESKRYHDLRYSVNHLKLIQLGLTFFNEEGSRPNSNGVWQFNFCDFDPAHDLHVPASIELLTQNGINFAKNEEQGISLNEFSLRFQEVLLSNPTIRWITFHGFYDLAYVVKIATKKTMPNLLNEFLSVVGSLFPQVYDLKFMSRFCEGLLDGELGLELLAKILDVKRVRESHQAGSDSLLTSCVFSEMKEDFELIEDMYKGSLYGLTSKIERTQPLPNYYCYQQFYYPVLVYI